MSIHKKLAEIQQNLKAPKGQKNKFGNYNYRSCEDILQAVKPLLGDCSLTLTDELVFSGMLEDEIVAAGVQVKTQRVYVKAIATLTNGTDFIAATAYAREASIKKGMDSSQLTGATSSYARKYALAGLFAIDSEADSDATNKHDSVIDNGQDMSLEGMAGTTASEPKKRIDKVLMQKSIAALVATYDAEDDAGLAETWTELERHEQEHIWHMLNSKQQKKIREVSAKGEVK